MNLRGIAFRLLGDVHAADEVAAAAWREPDPMLATAADCFARLGGRAAVPQWHVPDLVTTASLEHPHDQRELLAGWVGAGPFVALDTLTPSERVAFVLHDVLPAGQLNDLLAVDDVAGLASVGLQLIESVAVPDADVRRARAVVRALFKAAAARDVAAATALLHDDLQLRVDAGPFALSTVDDDAEAVVRRAVMMQRSVERRVDVLVNGSVGEVVVLKGAIVAIIGFTVVGDRVVRIDQLVDQSRVPQLFDLAALGGAWASELTR